MSPARVCPKCGKPLPSDGPQGQCPACLLAAALASQSDVRSAATAVLNSPATSESTPETGTRLKYFGDYELLEEIARGGMGVVWKARQSTLNRDVALKMIRTGVLASPDEVARFLREAEAAANLQHPNIVAIHEVGEHGGQHYFSMDLVTGRDLGTIVKDGPLSPRRAAGYVKIIAEAIHFAHQRGTLHRDLKPQNVLIDAADQPRITDFGLAKIMKEDSRLTQSGVVMGSPSYMPPEQAAGRHGDIGPASDVYSLGAMLYDLLTGRPPFRGATAMATLHDVMESEPASLRKLNANLPRDLETICLKCLEKSPAARYPTARALAEELGRFLGGEPIQARPAGAVRKAVSWGRRHPGTLAAVAALGIVTLSFGVFYLFEENAFLRAQQANPALARIPGWRHNFLRTLSLTNLIAVFLSFCAAIAIRRRTHGLSFKEALNPGKQFRPFQPLGERTRTFAVGAGMVLIGSAVILLLMTIQAHVWEGGSIFDVVFLIYALVYCGLLIVGTAIKDYRLVRFGTSSRQLTAEQIEPIRHAMEDYDVMAAIKLYREAVPDAGVKEAHQYVIRLADSLRAQHPDKFVPRPLSLAALNWERMAILALIEGFVLMLWLLYTPPTYPTSAVWHFAFSFLFGMGLMLGLRVNASWKTFWRRLLLLPALASMFVGWVIAAAFAQSALPYVGGLFFGVFLMFSAFTPRHKRT